MSSDRTNSKINDREVEIWQKKFAVQATSR